MFDDGYIIGEYEIVSERPEFYLVKVFKPNAKRKKARSCLPAKKKTRILIDDVYEEEDISEHGDTEEKKHDSKRANEEETITQEEIEKEIARITASSIEHFFDEKHVRTKLLVDKSMDLHNDHPKLIVKRSFGHKEDICERVPFVVFEDGRLVFATKAESVITYTSNGVLYQGDFAKASYVVHVSSGIVLSPHYRNQVIACYLDEESEETRFAAGRVESFHESPEEVRGVVQGVTFGWLPNDTQYNPHVDDILDVAETSSLPIHAVLCVADLLPWSVKSELLGDLYRTSLHSWEARCPQIQKFQNHLYDFLQFYHVRDAWVWRTSLGRHIYSDFIVPFKNFGQQSDEQNVELIHDLVVSRVGISFTPFDIAPYQARCDACKLTRMLSKQVVGGESGKLFHLGRDCAFKLSYLHKVFSATFAQRNSLVFDDVRMSSLIPSLLDFREDFRRNEHSYTQD